MKNLPGILFNIKSKIYNGVNTIQEGKESVGVYWDVTALCYMTAHGAQHCLLSWEGYRLMDFQRFGFQLW